jgi:alkylhydroperoxidase family enzyme
MDAYENRQLWDLNAWPKMYGKLKELQVMVFLGPPGIELNMMVFTISSLAAGCRHCQAHGAYGLDRVGVPTEKIQALWSYETSAVFDDRERAALDFGLAAGSTPSAVDSSHHRAIREHFSEEEARGLLATVALDGFMNRYNDALATVTDTESVEWAHANLGPLGWDIGKHVGADHERRPCPPGR